MTENQDTRVLLQKLINEKRWQEALNLLNSQPNSEELIGLRAKVEAHLGLITPADAYIIEYIGQRRNNYSREAIQNKLLEAGYSSESIQAAMQRFELSQIVENTTTEEISCASIFASIVIGLLIAFVMILCFMVVVVGTCKGL